MSLCGCASCSPPSKSNSSSDLFEEFVYCSCLAITHFHHITKALRRLKQFHLALTVPPSPEVSSHWPLNSPGGNSSSCLCISLQVFRLGNQQLRVIKCSVLVTRRFHPVTFLFPWWTLTVYSVRGFSCSTASSGLPPQKQKNTSRGKQQRRFSPPTVWNSSGALISLEQPSELWKLQLRLTWLQCFSNFPQQLPAGEAALCI